MLGETGQQQFKCFVFHDSARDGLLRSSTFVAGGFSILFGVYDRPQHGQQLLDADCSEEAGLLGGEPRRFRKHMQFVSRHRRRAALLRAGARRHPAQFLLDLPCWRQAVLELRIGRNGWLFDSDRRQGRLHGTQDGAQWWLQRAERRPLQRDLRPGAQPDRPLRAVGQPGACTAERTTALRIAEGRLFPVDWVDVGARLIRPSSPVDLKQNPPCGPDDSCSERRSHSSPPLPCSSLFSARRVPTREASSRWRRPHRSSFSSRPQLAPCSLPGEAALRLAARWRIRRCQSSRPSVARSRTVHPRRCARPWRACRPARRKSIPARCALRSGRIRAGSDRAPRSSV